MVFLLIDAEAFRWRGLEIWVDFAIVMKVRKGLPTLSEWGKPSQGTQVDNFVRVVLSPDGN